MHAKRSGAANRWATILFLANSAITGAAAQQLPTALQLLASQQRYTAQLLPAPTAPPVEEGVSAALAAHRSATIKNIVYELEFRIPAEKETTIPAKESLSFDLKENATSLQIDFKGERSQLQQLQVNGTQTPILYEREHILVSPQLLHRGPNTIRLQFIAGNGPLNRNPDYLYTLFVPDRARTLFPCFDQPDCKAVFDLTLSIPSGWKATTNAPLKDSITEGDSRTLHYLPSDKISTYLFSFVAGRFTESVSKEDGREMHFYYRETDSSKLRLSLGPVFRIQADALAFLQQYTGIAYPFRKFDFVGIPDFQFGGMEHPGAIQYKASALFLDTGATRDQIIARANVLSHETAHMWFGDMVTMSWFNDVWMKEVFANFMADKIGSITLPDDNYDLKFLTAHYPAAYSIDRTAGSPPIRQQLDNLQEAGSLYGNIIYHKAPVMMRQLERLMGADAFRDGLRDYLRQYAGGNATWSDLIRLLSAHTGSNLEAWNRVWVNEAGRPLFSYRLRTDKGRISQLEISQRGEDGSSRIWPQLFAIGLVYKDHMEELTVNSNTPRVSLDPAKGRPTPDYILFNTDGQGYGLFPVDRRSLPGLPAVKSSLVRAAAYINLQENMLDGRTITPRQLLAFDRRALSKEGEELNLNLLLDQLGNIFWRFLPPAARDSLAKGLEKDLWQSMVNVRSPNEKKLLFKAFGNIVLSREGEDSLYAIWKEQRPPSGIQLSEDDYTGLAATLALRAYPHQRQILEEQLQRIRNKDRKERFGYLLPSLSDSIEVRDAFFATLLTREGRKKEAWVLTALSYLHHPLRTAVSEKYLPRTLELLEEVQRTGDVFFPQSWLQASLGGYRSPTAAKIVRAFLGQHPGYNPKLKAKILQSSDNLFRAAQLIK